MERHWNDGIGILKERKYIIKKRRKDIIKEVWKDINQETMDSKNTKERKGRIKPTHTVQLCVFL